MAQPSIWGNALDTFQNAVANPLTLGGLSLLSGGDLNSGVQAGTVLQKQRQLQNQQQAIQQGIQGMPNLSDSDRQILGNNPDLANEVLSTIYKNRFDPMAGLDKQYKQAQIRHLDRETQTAGNDVYGNNGQIFQGSDGNWYSYQFAKNGKNLIQPITPPNSGAGAGAPSGPPISLTPNKGVEVVGDSIINKANGAPVRNVGPNLQGGEFSKKTGELTAVGANNLPKSQNELAQSKVSNDVVNSTIDDAIKNIDGYTSGFVGSVTSNIPGTKSYDLSTKLDTIKANIGFDKLQDMRNNSPTGGALGQVSEQENRLLQSTLASVSQSQSPDQLKANLGKIKAIRQQYQVLKQQAYQRDVARFGKANVPDPVTGQLPGGSTTVPKSSPAAAVKSGNYRYNPQTGGLEPIE